MAVVGRYIAGQIRESAQPFIRAYGQWVNEYIVPIVNDFDKRADALEQETLERFSAQVNPETYSGDGEELYEYAYEAKLSFYEIMESLYQATLNLFSTGLFHLIEQQLAAITHDAGIEQSLQDTKLDKVIDWYRKHFQIELRQFPSWAVIEELRLVANATKHAEGGSAKDLRQIRPELFRHPARRHKTNLLTIQIPIDLPLGGDGLYVTAEDFRRYDKIANELFAYLVEYFERNGEQYYPR